MELEIQADERFKSIYHKAHFGRSHTEFENPLIDLNH